MHISMSKVENRISKRHQRIQAAKARPVEVTQAMREQTRMPKYRMITREFDGQLLAVKHKRTRGKHPFKGRR